MSKMIKTFESTIRLEKFSGRTRNMIATLNSTCTSVAGSAMVVLDASPIPDTNEILGKIQFAVDDVKVVLGVITPNMDSLSAFASRYNMCAAHYCDIKFYVEESTKILRLEFTPPSETYEGIIQNFFEMTSPAFAE